MKPPKPKGPPPPFEFRLDLPPEGAEVPYVKNYEPPPPEPEPQPAPENAAEQTAEGDEFYIQWIILTSPSLKNYYLMESWKHFQTIPLNSAKEKLIFTAYSI